MDTTSSSIFDDVSSANRRLYKAGYDAGFEAGYARANDEVRECRSALERALSFLNGGRDDDTSQNGDTTENVATEAAAVNVDRAPYGAVRDAIRELLRERGTPMKPIQIHGELSAKGFSTSVETIRSTLHSMHRKYGLVRNSGVGWIASR